MITISYMRGMAQQWVAPKLKSYFDNSTPSLVRISEDFDEFKGELRKDFSIAKEPVIAEGKIQRLRQTGAVGDYANLFQCYSIQTEWDDKALMRMFKQGLRAEVRIELMRSGGIIEDLRSLIEEPIRIDNNLMEFRLETRGYEPLGKFPKQKNHRSNDKRQRGSPHIPRHYGTNRPESMHLDKTSSAANHVTTPLLNTKARESPITARRPVRAIIVTNLDTSRPSVANRRKTQYMGTDTIRLFQEICKGD
jgi:hypothetical protein